MTDREKKRTPRRAAWIAHAIGPTIANAICPTIANAICPTIANAICAAIAGAICAAIAPAICVAAVLWTTPARADPGSLGALTVGVGIGMGFQPDSRPCETAGSGRPLPGGGGCALFAGGVDASFLWRGHVGAALGLWSVAGQAAVPQGQPPSGQAPAAYPDRISIPLQIDLRPLSFMQIGSEGSYLRRVSYGVRFAIGPSLELVRTSSDSSFDFADRTGDTAKALLGMHINLDGEVPLHASLPSALSLRMSLRVLYTPLVVLNDGVVQSSPISSSDQTPAMLSSTLQGYATHFQFLLGLVYYL